MTARAFEIFRIFLLLGLTSFGGPVAHIGFFRDAFVVKRQWLSERTYADLVALCQFLPGPASSQVGMAIGLQRAGYAGLFAAWLGFTLPSAILLVAFVYGAAAVGLSAGVLQGLKVAAVAVVAYAVIGMARSLVTDTPRALIAALGVVLALLLPTSLGQVLVIVAGGLIGFLWLRASANAEPHETLGIPVRRRTAIACLIAFFALLIALPLAASATSDATLHMIDGFYRTGSLVFGGGHVVLPLLQAEMVDTGRVSDEIFLAGYGAAQAVPGPLFSFAAYLGAAMGGISGAIIALVAIYVPSALLVIGALPFWDRLRSMPPAQSALAGVNAAVVGLLAAALYNPVMTEGVTSIHALALALVCFAALWSQRIPVWAIVIASGLAGYFLL